MKKTFALICFLLLLSPLLSAQAPSTKQKALALTHVTLIDATGGRSRQDMTVVIHGDRIVDMGKSRKIRVPAGSRSWMPAANF